MQIKSGIPLFFVCVALILLLLFLYIIRPENRGFASYRITRGLFNLHSMKAFLIPVFLVLLVSAHGQQAMSVGNVRAELEAMLETDQLHRRELIELEKKHGRDSAEVKAAWSKQSAIDAQNIRRLEEIIAQYGWPGSKQFGDKAANTAFLILQHSDLSYQKKYLPLVREAVGAGDLRASSLALLEDRVRLREGQKQIYGSQVTRNSDDEWEPLPLEDEENVDTRRASVGLGPILEYLQRFAARSGGKVNPKWEKYGSKANPPVQHKAGSRPDSTDSPASETSSAPASPVAN